MFRSFMRLAATAAALGLATAAAAAPVVYTGSKTLSNGTNTIKAVYSITTDGTFGSNVNIGAHVTDYSVSLDDGTSIFGYSRIGTGGTGSVYGSFTASATDLRIGAFDQGLMSNSNGLTAAGSFLGLFNVSNFGATAQISDASHTTYINSLDFVNGGKPFATAAAAAVPETATWAMMILGMGAIGFAMRRQKVTMRVSYAA